MWKQSALFKNRYLQILPLILFSYGKVSGQWSPSHAPYIIGHRGMMMDFPENTLAAFAACVTKGIGIEIDIRTSKDSQLIIIHDETFLRTTNGPDLPIRELTLSQIKKLDAGSWFGEAFKGQRIPTLEETFQLVKKAEKRKVPIALNIKDISEDDEKKLIGLLEKYKLLKQSFCFDQSRQVSQRLKSINKKILIGQNVNRSQFNEMLRDDMVDVFLLSFIPSNEDIEQLRQFRKKIIFNLAGPGKNRDNPEYWDTLLRSEIDAILVDHAFEFHKYQKNK